MPAEAVTTVDLYRRIRRNNARAQARSQAQIEAWVAGKAPLRRFTPEPFHAGATDVTDAPVHAIANLTEQNKIVVWRHNGRFYARPTP